MAKIHLSFIAAIIAVIVTLNGNILAADAGNAATGPRVTPAPAPAPAEPNFASMNPDTVMAKYGDQKLTLQDIKYIIPTVTPESARQLAQQWVDLQIMYDAAKKRGLTNDPKTKLLVDLGGKSLYARELMNKVAADVNVPDANVREYYNRNKNVDPSLFEPNRLSFTHVKTATVEEANSVKKRIEAGEDIETIAKEVSTAQDAKNGGAVKRSPESLVQQQYGKEFFDAFMASSEGKIIGPIKVKDGYEVARHEGRLSGKVYPYEMVKDSIKRREEQMAKSEATQKYMDDLKKAEQSKVYISPLLEAPKPRAEEGKMGKEPNLPIDKTKIKLDNAAQKK